MQETQVQSLGWEDSLGWGDSLKNRMPTHSRILAWQILRLEESGRLKSIGLQRVGHD